MTAAGLGGYSWLSVLVETAFLVVVLGLAVISRRPGKPRKRGELNGREGWWFFVPDMPDEAMDEPPHQEGDV